MQAKTMIRVALVMTAAYAVLSFYCWIAKDHDHMLMFLAGTTIWGIGVFVWSKVLEVEKDEA
jgi:hypothetical protein